MTMRHITGSTMSRPAAAVAGVVLLALAGPACERARTSAGSAGSGSTTEATGASSGSGDGATSGGSGPGSTGQPIDCGQIEGSDVPDVCPDMTTEEDCVTAITGPLAECFHCVWSDWVPVTLDGGACVFGQIQATCVRERLSPGPGCEDAGGVSCRPATEMGLYREVDGQPQIQSSVRCHSEGGMNATKCAVDDQGKATNSPPECACICDPDFPG